MEGAQPPVPELAIVRGEVHLAYQTINQDSPETVKILKNLYAKMYSSGQPYTIASPCGGSRWI